jgi:type VI secretion system secreted protein Hcp
MPAMPGGAALRGDADYFLHVQTKRAGKLKGEAIAPEHKDDILVLRWSWGVNTGSAVAEARATARRSYSALTVVKTVDSATTALLSALATNDQVKEAKLTARRSGGGQDSFFSITLKGARISSLQHQGKEDGSTEEVMTIAFSEVEVEYRSQQRGGQRGGAYVFNDSLPQSS